MFKKVVVYLLIKTNIMNNKTQESVENGILVIEFANDNNLSLSEAARQLGFGKNYVSDIRTSIEENYEKRNINRTLYRKFNATLKAHTKIKNVKSLTK